MADALSEQIKSHFRRSISEGYQEIKFGAGPVQLTYFADEGRGVIDVVADVEKNPYKLKEHFDKVRKSLPEGEWELNPDTPQKQRIYQRWFRNDPNIKPSGDTNMKLKGREGFVMTKTSNKNALSIDKKPWTIKNDIYILKDDSAPNRRLLERHLTQRIKEGYKPKGILYGNNKVPHRLSTKSIGRVLDPNDPLDKVNIKQSRTGKPSPRKKWGKEQMDAESQQLYTAKTRTGLLDETVNPWLIKPEKMHGHHVRMLQMYNPFFEGLSDYDKKRLSAYAVQAKYPLGDAKSNIMMLDEDFHNQIHKFMIDEGFQVRKGVSTKHGIPPLGDSFESRQVALQSFFDNVQEPIERKLSALRWDQQARYNPLSQTEFDNQLAWFNDKERIIGERSLLSGVDADNVELGKRLGGIGSNISRATKAATGLSRAESVLRIAGGDYIGGAAGLAMTTPTFQKQMGKLLLKQGIKMIPGVSFGSGALQAVGYAAGGQWTKAGLSALGGVIGELGPAGDAVQAAIDLGLTGHDIKLGDINRVRPLDADNATDGFRKGVISIGRSL